jgi:hypothetical protein
MSVITTSDDGRTATAVLDLDAAPAAVAGLLQAASEHGVEHAAQKAHPGADRSQAALGCGRIGPTRWALDCEFDQTADARVPKLLHVVDEFTREALAVELERLVTERGRAPGHIRCDNCPELTTRALRAWCRFDKAGSAYIEPGHRGRIVTWSPSAPASEMGCSPSSRSAR